MSFAPGASSSSLTVSASASVFSSAGTSIFASDAPGSTSTFAGSSSNLSQVLPSSSGADGTDDGVNDSSPISKSSSLLFGFLVTILALFIGFMACGYTSRRSAALHRRRGHGGDEFPDPWSTGSRPKERPVLWDAHIEEKTHDGSLFWEDIIPLSVIISTRRPKNLRRGSSTHLAETNERRRYEQRPWWTTYVMPGIHGLGRIYSPAPRLRVSASRDRDRRTTSESAGVARASPGSHTPSLGIIRGISTWATQNIRPLFHTASTGSQRNQSNADAPQTTMTPTGNGPVVDEKQKPEEDALDAMRGRRAQIAVLIVMPSPSRHLHPKERALSNSSAEDAPPVCEIGISRTRIAGKCKTPEVLENS